MSAIVFNNITFNYAGSGKDLFADLSLNIDTSWKLGLTGRNGRGKTTFLQLVHGSLQPVRGNIHSDVNTFYFPFSVNTRNKYVKEVIRNCIAPFDRWEAEMEGLLTQGSRESILEYGNILEMYQMAGGYEINSMIDKEISAIGMDSGILTSEFDKLSGGEQTRALLVSLFLKKNSFPLIDEPTNHLDMEGRAQLADYLESKGGYIVVSHDRYFLDKCTDHIISINKNDVTVNKGNYSVWKYNFDITEEFERRKNENIKREVKSLEQAARKRRSWSIRREKEKTGAYDKGFIGHRAAKQMKRALNIERRMAAKLEEKKALLKNAEKERILKIETSRSGSDIILYADDVLISFDGREIVKNFSLTLRKGDRMAIIGKNGSGKTSILNILAKEMNAAKGYVNFPVHYKFFYMKQNPRWAKGLLGQYLKNENIDETCYRNIIAALGMEGDIFTRPLETFSKGENKKAELAKSFIMPYDVLIWDEPLNYLDVLSREQIEETILKHEPTVVFTEHDRRFIENIATEIIEL